MFSRPKVLLTLEGKAEQVLPFLEHPSRRVVLRAVELLCHVDGEPGLPRIRALAMKYPCEIQLGNSAAVMANDRSLVPASACPYDPRLPIVAPARTISAWPADVFAARSITSGDTSILERTLWDLEALEPVRAQRAVATLSKVNDPAAVLATIRGLVRRIGKEAWAKVDELNRGVVGAQLDGLAATRAAAWCLVIARASPEDLPLFQMFLGSVHTELPREADRARRTADLTLFGRAYLEKLSHDQHDWMATREKIRRFVDHRDRPALRAFLKDDANGIADRMEAAKELAVLGDPSGLVLWNTDRKSVV